MFKGLEMKMHLNSIGSTTISFYLFLVYSNHLQVVEFFNLKILVVLYDAEQFR